MKRHIITAAVVMAAISCTMSAQNRLRFGEDKSFRIAQFTDMHLDPGTPYRRAQAEKTFARLGRVLREEKPDFIAFTGDIVTGKPAAGMWNRLLDTLNLYRIPFCVVLGNHDAEQDITRQEIADIVARSPYSLNTLGSTGELADRELKVLSSKGKDVAFAMYFMDSHDYAKIDGLDGYGWFTPEQVSWLRNSCADLTADCGGRHVPSLAFFHICLQEYETAWRNRSNSHIGRAAEEECPGVLNTGMYAAMVESGNIMGVFVGHDHDIDYIVAQYGTALGYGRFSGDDTTYNNLRPGVRIIVVREGQRAFESWIVEDDGRIVDHIDYDGEIRKHRK